LTSGRLSGLRAVENVFTASWKDSSPVEAQAPLSSASRRDALASDSSPGQAGGFGNVSRSKRLERNRFAAP